jgi:hypothetical protein
MPRTVVYDTSLVQAELEDETPRAGKSKITGPPGRVRRKVAQKPRRKSAADVEKAAELPVKDDYTAKIAKYVPGEVVAVAIAGFAAFNPTGNWVWFAIGLGIVGNLVYLAANAMNLSAVSRPRPYFYFLSAFAFVAWAAATIPQVRSKLGLEGAENADKAAYILFAAAFGLPLLDTLFNGLEVRAKND